MSISKEISEKLKKRKFNKRGLWHEYDENLSYEDAIDLSIASLKAYGADYPHWIIAYSGGKDSSALLAFVLWCIQNKHVEAPKTLRVLYADTRMELPPLHLTAQKVLARVKEMGYEVQLVEPPLSRRYWVEILGKGLPPPKRTMRWCTERLKKDPMNLIFNDIAKQYGESVLTLTGVRKGESSVRDQRINTSCSSNDGECGQGWFQKQKNALAPLLHWRVCWIWDFLNSDKNAVPETLGITPVYVTDDITDIRTGCIGCPIVSRDWALEYLVKQPEFEHLTPLTELKPMYDVMLQPIYRHRRGLYKKVDGTYSDKMSNTIGAMSIDARKLFYEKVRDIEKRSGYQLISRVEGALIRLMWKKGVMPDKWTGNEPLATIIRDVDIVKNGEIIATQYAIPEMKGSA